MNNVIISTHGLKKYYFVGESTVKALDGVDMTVNKGESVCIAGRSGSGKSTLLNMLAGLELPTSCLLYTSCHAISLFFSIFLIIYTRG